MGANRIKMLREEKNMTQIRLSIELNVSQETVSAYEMGKHYPSVKTLLRMSEIFDASMDYILGVSPVRNAVSEKNLPNDEIKIIQLLRKLSKAKQEKVFSYMQGLAE
jgi:transcriptional regulator with XRE-family HTH domain